MDAPRFDALARALRPGSRRGLLGVLLTLPVAGGLLALLGLDDATAKGRRKRRKKRHKHGQGNGRHRKGKRKRRCQRKKSRARICRGKCGIVKNKQTCQKKVNCGACGPACADLLPTDDLQEAIDATPDGGELLLCAGTWALASTVTIPKSLTLRGVGAEHTILDGQDAVRVLQIAAGVAVTLQDLTVTGGSNAGNGGGIFNTGDLTLRGVTVTDNETTVEGGGSTTAAH